MARPDDPAPFAGLLNLFKPSGMTSARAVDHVRRATGIRKSGHAGTLDPAADGVLLICMGRATKRVERLMDLSKAYRATGRLDVTSRSLDSDSPLEPVAIDAVPDRDQLVRAGAALVGVIQQVPPAVSAIKVGGVRAYRRVLRGQTVALPPRPVLVYDLAITAYDWPHVTFDVRCGRGTYVRSLIRDLGAAVGAGGCLTALRRTAVGPFTSDAAIALDRLEPGTALAHCLDLEALDTLLQSAR